MVTVKLGPYIATVHNGEWRCPESESIERSLQRHFTPARLSGYYPDVDHALAEMAVKRLDGEIVDEGEPPETVAGRVY